MFSTIRKKLSRPLNYLFTNLFITMEDDYIGCSHQKLRNLVSSSKNEDEAVKEYIKRTSYPSVNDFEKNLEWFNVSEPLSFTNHLKGKIVLLDFFTYCCINCMHILPDLRDLENEFSIEDGLVVVGVHSAKFDNEKDSKNILAAIQRYNINHPVVNDHKMKTWTNCEVHCWPTLLLLGPNANPLVMLTGEGHKENLRLYIKNALEFYKEKGEISNKKLPLKSAFHLLPENRGVLLFPGKITSYYNEKTNGDILAIADTGNHRILLSNSFGKVYKQIGNGSVGFKDGNFEVAEFNAPQGLVFDGSDVIYVADTENHAIRKISLKEEQVETIAGTGSQGHDQKGGNLGKSQSISSPWDLCVYNVKDSADDEKVLLIAMAGTHQIWGIFLNKMTWWKNQVYEAGTCVNIAGSGREENRNNQYPHTAAFAQPSGLALHEENKEVYIADSESSSVRRLSLIDGKVSAVVGGDKNPNNLFAFGDKDGKLQEAKLQHPLGLGIFKDSLFVADTYNHKIKVIDIKSNNSSTLPISSLNEPGGLTVGSNGKVIYVADTNNHSVKKIFLKDDFQIEKVENLIFKTTEGTPKKQGKVSEIPTFNNKAIAINNNGGSFKLKINLKFLNGLKPTPEAVQKWFVKSPSAAWSIAPNSGNNIHNIDVVCKVPEILPIEQNYLDCVFNLITCTEDSCIAKKFIVRQPLIPQEGGLSDLESTVNVELDPKNICLKNC